MRLTILQFVPESLPTYRADVSVLFGKYLPRHAIVTDLVGKAGPDPLPEQGYGRVWRARHYAGAVWRELDFLWLCVRTLLGASRRRYDVIQVRDMVPIGLLGLLVARLKGIPFTYWLSFLMSEGRIEVAQAALRRRPTVRNRLKLLKGRVERTLLYRLVLPHASHVFVQSDAMAELLRSYGIAPERITAVPMGVDMETVPAADAAAPRPAGWEQAPLIAYLGTLNQARQLERVIDALLQVRREFPAACLLLVGAASPEAAAQDLLAHAAALGLADAVRITGWLPSAQAWHCLQGADAAVSYIPRGALFDVSSPTKLLEYLALGMPAVGNDSPDQQVVLAASGAGWLTGSTAGELADAMCAILRDPAAARRRAAAGPAYIEAHRSYRVLAQALAARYQALRPASSPLP